MHLNFLKISKSLVQTYTNSITWNVTFELDNKTLMDKVMSSGTGNSKLECLIHECMRLVARNSTIILVSTLLTMLFFILSNLLLMKLY